MKFLKEFKGYEFKGLVFDLKLSHECGSYFEVWYVIDGKEYWIDLTDRYPDSVGMSEEERVEYYLNIWVERDLEYYGVIEGE